MEEGQRALNKASERKSVHEWTPEEIRESLRQSEARVAGPLIEEIERWRRESLIACRDKLVGGPGHPID